METTKEDGVSLKQLFEVLYHYLWLFVIGIILGVSTYLIIINVKDSKFESNGSILVSIYGDSKSVISDTKNDNIVRTVNSLVDKDTIIINTIEDLNIDMSINDFTNKYEINHTIENNFINISCITTDKDNGIKVINTILDNICVYMDENEKIYTGSEYFIDLFVIEYATYVTKLNDNFLIILISSVFLCEVASFIIMLILFYSSSKYIGFESLKKDLEGYNDDIKVYKRKDKKNIIIFDNLLNQERIVIDSYDDAIYKEFRNDIINCNVSESKIVDIKMKEEITRNSMVILIVDFKKNTKEDINCRLSKYIYKNNKLIIILNNK